MTKEREISTQDIPTEITKITMTTGETWASQLVIVVKNLPANAGDAGSVSGWGKSSGEGNGYPPQYSCLKNSMDRGAWQAPIHGVARVRHNLVTKPPPPPRQLLAHAAHVMVHN